MTMVWVVARNARRRPMLMHRVEDFGTRTVCGVDIDGWQREWFRRRPTGAASILLCQRCDRKAVAGAPVAVVSDIRTARGRRRKVSSTQGLRREARAAYGVATHTPHGG